MSDAWKGFSLPALAQFGVRRVQGGVEVPYFTEDRGLYRCKLFPDDGEVRTRWIGESKPQIPYGLETLNMGGRALFLTEGESDALALRLSYPKTPTLGIPGASAWRSEWIEYANRFEIVYLSFDADDAGRKLYDTVATEVPHYRGVLLPEGTDTRAVLQALGREGYKTFLEDATHRAALWAALERTATTSRECRQLAAAMEKRAA